VILSDVSIRRPVFAGVLSLLLVILGLAALAQDLPTALACLCARAALSQIDVPARQSLVMSVVPPEERAAAASVTNVPRSLAAALAPLPAGWLLTQSDFGWPLLCAAGLKLLYDVLLLARFGRIEARTASAEGER